MDVGIHDWMSNCCRAAERVSGFERAGHVLLFGLGWILGRLLGSGGGAANAVEREGRPLVRRRLRLGCSRSGRHEEGDERDDDGHGVRGSAVTEAPTALRLHEDGTARRRFLFRRANWRSGLPSPVSSRQDVLGRPVSIIVDFQSKTTWPHLALRLR